MSDELTLTINNKIISGWAQVRVTRGIERLPSDFELSLMDYYPGSDEQQLVKAGDSCVVKLGSDRVVTGYIDKWAPLIKRSSHEVTATGRSKCEDLVDCSAEWPNNVISNANALQIAQRLAKPYGITVSSDIEGMATVPQFTLNWGETVQEIIDRIAGWAALLFYDQPDGNLFMTRVGTKKASSGVAQGINIQEAKYESSMDKRFSNYTGVSLSVTPMTRNHHIASRASATDPEALTMRYRHRIVIVESTTVAHDKAQDSINWEMNRRYGRSKVLNVTVDSWRDSAGKLWEPNTLIPISIPAFGLNNESWLLSEVSYLRDKQGTSAQMVLMPPEAFAIKPYQSKK